VNFYVPVDMEINSINLLLQVISYLRQREYIVGKAPNYRTIWETFNR